MNNKYCFEVCLENHKKLYPLATTSDYIKLAFQAEFGPEHIVYSFKEAFEALKAESSFMLNKKDKHFSFPISNELTRFYLTGEESEIELSLITFLFMETAQQTNGNDKGFLEKLALMKPLLDEGELNIYLEKGIRALHHSDCFRTAYEPHYRLIKREYAFYYDELLYIYNELYNKRNVVLSIDGRCASGKTSLATMLSTLFPTRIFHTDDFYLPFEKREPNWKSIVGGNMDFNRLEAEVLKPCQNALCVEYKAYSCSSGKFSAPIIEDFKPLTIIEGSYSCYSDFRKYYDKTIFLTVNKEEQRKRLIKRGENIENFETMWIPFEENYIKAFNVQALADFEKNTEQLF